MRVFAFLCAAALVSCHTGSSNTVSGALIMTSIALGTSVANRAAGSCYAVCQQGERCNEKTGMCEGLPCRGQCMAGETCEEGFFGVRCLPNASLAVSASQREPPPPPPAPEETSNMAVPDAAKP